MIRLLVSLLLATGLSGCYLSGSADDTEELARTWNGATVVVPFSRHDSAVRDVEGRMDEIEATLARIVGPKLPVVIFLHGCSGLHGGYRVDIAFLESLGYAVVAPDSFARDYKPKSCDWRTKSAGSHPGVVGFRLAEASHAIARVREMPWVDSRRIVLMGQSEGGLTTANHDGRGVAARVILGWTCQIPWPPLWGLAGPRDQPVLSVVSADDRWFQRWFVKGDCGEDMDGFADATSVVVDGSTHHVMRLPEARDAVAAFLGRVVPSGVGPKIAAAQ